MGQRGVICKDIKSGAGEDRLPFLETVDYREHFFVVRGIITFCRIKRPRMEPCGTHSLVVLSLAVISSYGVVTGIGDNEDRLRIIVGNRSANRGVFNESFDILKCLLLCFLPHEIDAFLSESREERRMLSESRNESTNIFDETEESSYFRDITRDWPV